MIAKIMVDGADRPTALARLRRALDETEVTGIQTTLPFDRAVVRNPRFAAGDVSTDWVGEEWDGQADRARALEIAVAVVASAQGRVAGTAGTAGARRAATAAPPAAPSDDATEATATGPARGWAAAARDEAVDRWPR
jgi:acetyl/propionyl-CoA carboxylase alpha subunit